MNEVLNDYPIPPDTVRVRRVSERQVIDEAGKTYQMDGGPCLFYDDKGNKFGLSERPGYGLLIPVKPGSQMELWFKDGVNWCGLPEV